jgi:hypothetical protein
MIHIAWLMQIFEENKLSILADGRAQNEKCRINWHARTAQ